MSIYINFSGHFQMRGNSHRDEGLFTESVSFSCLERKGGMEVEKIWKRMVIMVDYRF